MTTAVKDLFNVQVRRVPRIGACALVDNDVHLGIEIEMENVQTPSGHDFSDSNTARAEVERAGWRVTTDGSLVNGMEFVFADAMLGVEAEEALKKLEANVRFAPSHRASTHIHVDWSSVDDASSLISLAGLLYCFEPAIFNIVMEGRKSNNYCRPLETVGTAALVPLFTKGVTYLAGGYLGGAVSRGDTTYRYFGANFISLSKYGTVEFRYFPSPTSANDVLFWTNICLCLRRAALGMAKDGINVLEALSTTSGIASIVDKYFSDKQVRDAMLLALDIELAAERMRVMGLLVAADPQTTPERAAVSRSMRRLLDNMVIPPEAKERMTALTALRAGIAEGRDAAEIRRNIRTIVH